MNPVLNNIYRVGVLQNAGLPVVSLYVDGDTGRLYVFVRMSEPKCSPAFFTAVQVSPEDVFAYMEEEKSLEEMFQTGNPFVVSISGKTIELTELQPSVSDGYMTAMNYFDADFCDDDVWIETFLNRLIVGKTNTSGGCSLVNVKFENGENVSRHYC